MFIPRGGRSPSPPRSPRRGRDRGRGRSSDGQPRPSRPSSTPPVQRLDLFLAGSLGQRILPAQPPEEQPGYVVCSSQPIRYGLPGELGFQSRVMSSSRPFIARRSAPLSCAARGGGEPEDIPGGGEPENPGGGEPEKIPAGGEPEKAPGGGLVAAESAFQDVLLPSSDSSQLYRIPGLSSGDAPGKKSLFRALGIRLFEMKVVQDSTNGFSSKSRVPLLGPDVYEGIVESKKIWFKVFSKEKDGLMYEEALLRCAFDHQNLVRIYGACETEAEVILLFEAPSGQSLSKRLEEGHSLSVSEVLDISSSVARGLLHLISGDDDTSLVPETITSHQIWINDSKNCILLDMMGASKCLGGNTLASVLEVTRSFGLILLELLNVKACKSCQGISKDTVKMLRKVADRCVSENEFSRPSFDIVVEMIDEATMLHEAKGDIQEKL